MSFDDRSRFEFSLRTLANVLFYSREQLTRLIYEWSNMLDLPRNQNSPLPAADQPPGRFGSIFQGVPVPLPSQPYALSSNIQSKRGLSGTEYVIIHEDDRQNDIIFE